VWTWRGHKSRPDFNGKNHWPKSMILVVPLAGPEPAQCCHHLSLKISRIYMAVPQNPRQGVYPRRPDGRHRGSWSATWPGGGRSGTEDIQPDGDGQGVQRPRAMCLCGGPLRAPARQLQECGLGSLARTGTVLRRRAARLVSIPGRRANQGCACCSYAACSRQHLL
jgi:hypothetical protein